MKQLLQRLFATTAARLAAVFSCMRDKREPGYRREYEVEFRPFLVRYSCGYDPRTAWLRRPAILAQTLNVMQAQRSAGAPTFVRANTMMNGLGAALHTNCRCRRNLIIPVLKPEGHSVPLQLARLRNSQKGRRYNVPELTPEQHRAKWVAAMRKAKPISMDLFHQARAQDTAEQQSGMYVDVETSTIVVPNLEHATAFQASLDGRRVAMWVDEPMQVIPTETWKTIKARLAKIDAGKPLFQQGGVAKTMKLHLVGGSTITLKGGSGEPYRSSPRDWRDFVKVDPTS